MSCNCNKCNDNPCSCKGCEPARYSCGFSIEVDPFDPYVWLFNNCGKLERIRIPKIPETCTSLTADFSSASLIYDSECGKDIITGCDLGSLINLDCLRDVEAPNADSCDLLVFDPGCSDCGGACKPRPAMWRNYHIPDAGDCEIPLDSEGYYHVLIKDDCGCIKECRLPVVPDGSTTINYTRDSVPDDPDFPWYYGCYNDTINLHLEDNVSYWFGKYDLEVTINYGIQTVRPTKGENVNFRSLLVPVVEDVDPVGAVTSMASILQGSCSTRDASGKVILPWGTVSMRGTITFIVPKGKEASLRHEFRYRTKATGSKYWDYTWRSAQSPSQVFEDDPVDGKKVDDDIAGSVNLMLHNASRLNALQAIVRPCRGVNKYHPVVDPVREQLDADEDIYQNVPGDLPDDPEPEPEES